MYSELFTIILVFYYYIYYYNNNKHYNNNYYYSLLALTFVTRSQEICPSLSLVPKCLLPDVRYCS